MSDNEQGFAIDQLTELIDYNYQPSSRAWTAFTKKCFPKLKKQHALTLVTCGTRLINTSIHNQWIQDLINISKPKNIVFSSGTKMPTEIAENNVVFLSDFQSGNMEIISRVKSNQYELYMKPDSNTKSHFQWFNFKMSIKKAANRTIKFIIRNFIKSAMLYTKGLKPYCRSLKNTQYHQFRQIQSPVKFYQDQFTNCYNLQFYYTFQYDNDQLQFCSQPPYTFTHLNKFIDPLKCKKLTLTKTVMGTKIPYLIYQAKKQVKTIAIAIARQHPGQTVGSWMVQGFINQLNEQKLNDYISWYVIPMVNIDGVIIGNNRTGILGHDFNRNWMVQQHSNSRFNKLFPEIQGIISLIRTLKRKFPRKVKMFLDFHGHSSQPNVFTYGPPHEQQSQYFIQSRLFPELIARKNHNFKLSQCSYVLHPEKKNTARSIVFYNMGVPFTYTIQSTFGVLNEKNALSDDFIKIGQDVALSAYQFLHTTILKQSNHSCQSLLQDLKIKYANNSNNGQEYESASQASDENPNRKKIQQMVIADDLQGKNNNTQQQTLKVSKRYEQNKNETLQRQQKFRSLMKPIDQKQKRSYTTKKAQKRRINTQIQLVLKKKQCIFPNIVTKNSKLGFDQISFTSNSHSISHSSQDIVQNMKFDDIQKRLQKLRNSKIGKKILVINAYCA